MDEPKPLELTIAEQTNWRTINNMETAWDMAIAMQKAEDSTEGLVEGATKVDVGTYLLWAASVGIVVPLVSLKASDINKHRNTPIAGTHVINDPGYGRESLLREVVRTEADLKKVPPVVVFYNRSGLLLTMDGQNRVSLAKKMGPNTQVAAYVLPRGAESQKDVTNFCDELKRRSRS